MSSGNATKNQDLIARRIRLQQWTLWECADATLEKMLAELEQERGKLETQIESAEQDFHSYILAGDPITAEDARQNIRDLGEKWDALQTRTNDIEAILRQKALDNRIIALGQRLGIRNLVSVLSRFRLLIIGLSLFATAITLYPSLDNKTFVAMDGINLACSLFLTSEFVIRLVLVQERLKYLFSRALDIFIALPLIGLTANFLDLNFVARLLTLLRIGRFARLLLGERRDVFYNLKFLRSREFGLLQRAAATAIILVAISAGAFQFVEGTQRPEFANYSENLWWGIKIVLTANIDQTPGTLLGRLLTILIVLVGVSVTGILIATITAVLVNLSAESSDSDRQQETLQEKINTMSVQIDVLTSARQDAARAAARISYALVNVQIDQAELLADVVDSLVREFGCLEASIYRLDEVSRTVYRIVQAGDSGLWPDERIPFEEGILGESAMEARRGNTDLMPHFEIEPLPLADAVALAIPLFVRTETRRNRRVFGLGVLHVVVPQAWARDEMIRLLLTDVSGSLSQHLHERDVSTGVDNLLESIADLQTTMEQVTITREYDRLLFVIAQGAAELINADMSKVMLTDPNGISLRGVAWHGMDDTLGRSLYTRIGEGLSGICAKTGNPIKSSNLLTDQRVTATSSQALRSGMRSELCVPIQLNSTVLGVLSVMSEQHKRFSQEEETLLWTLAGQAGAAIENARIHAIEQRRLRAAETAQLISQRLVMSVGDRADADLLPWLLAQIKHLVPYDRAEIWRVDDTQWRLIASAGDGSDPALDDPARLSFGTLQESTQPTIITSNDGEIKRMIAPLIAEDQVIGVLSLESAVVAESESVFDDLALESLQTFAVQAALCIRLAQFRGKAMGDL